MGVWKRAQPPIPQSSGFFTTGRLPWFERVVGVCLTAGLIGGEGFAVDASLIVADANKQRSIPGSEWNKARGNTRTCVVPFYHQRPAAGGQN
jgi:hypothetical protein